ncbi:alpha/beta-hydrolase [Daedaleopsis nitida]|nr:alpha/beta-hydrolase [Daedaleopsis nitida]
MRDKRPTSSLGSSRGISNRAYLQYAVHDKSVPVQDGEIGVRVILPVTEDENATFPILVWFHGGGFMVGDLEMDDFHLRTIGVELQLAIVNVDYRLTPEYQFPTAHDDCYAAMKWVVEQAAELKLSLDKGFIIGGDSAGGNLSAALAVRARDDPFFAAHPLTGQYLREPSVVIPGAVPDKHKDVLRSMKECKYPPFLDEDKVLMYMNLYGAQPASILMSPLLAESHSGLPPAFVQVMECDPLRDEGILYERLLREAGSATKLVRYPGCPHGFHYSFPGISATAKVDQDEREGLKWLLSLQKNS